MNPYTLFQTNDKSLEKNIGIIVEQKHSSLTERFNLTARIVLANVYEHISVPFLKWQTFNLRGA